MDVADDSTRTQIPNQIRRAIAQRMVNQGLRRPVARDVRDVVHGLVGVQAQEFQYALWSVAQRIDGAVDRTAMLKVFDEGLLLRTHVLRTTWHFALPADIRWMLRLTAPRLRGLTAYYDRQLELDRQELDRAEAVLAELVAGGRHRTRKNLGAALRAAGIPADGQRLGHIMMHAEFDEVLISGAMQGRQQTYAAFDERVPAGPDLDEQAALAELAGRFVAGRGPVTARDLATWASLTLTQARRGLAAIEADCVVTELDGLTMFSAEPSSDPGPVETASPTVDLVQGYDEIVMSYSESRGLLSGGPGLLPSPDRSQYLHTILIDGKLVGHWRHRLGRDEAQIETQLRRPLSVLERPALEIAVQRYGKYLGLRATLAESTVL